MNDSSCPSAALKVASLSMLTLLSIMFFGSAGSAAAFQTSTACFQRVENPSELPFLDRVVYEFKVYFEFAATEDCVFLTDLLKQPKGFRDESLTPLYNRYRSRHVSTDVIPDTLDEFREIHELDQRPGFVVDTAIPRFAAKQRKIKRIFQQDLELSVAESLLEGEIVETEIIVKRQDGGLAFYVYDAEGRLSNSTLLADREIPLPYVCMACHYDEPRNEFAVVGNIELFEQRFRNHFDEILSECASCHNSHNGLPVFGLSSRSELQRVLAANPSLLQTLINSVDRSESPMPPIWPLSSGERDLFREGLMDLLN